MPSRIDPRLTASLALAAALTMSFACAAESPAPTASLAAADAHAAHLRVSNGELTPAQLQAVARVRQATVRFHDLDAAKDAGYTVQFPQGCAVSPTGEGAQAFHFLNPALAADGVVDLLQPELLMYEPLPNGKLQLVGVDYVVPMDLAASAPTLLGEQFMPVPALGVYALHIWTRRPNPNGMFAMWNPKVSCEYADRVPQEVLGW